MRRYGCGVVAMGDVLIYLGIHRLPCNTDLLYGMLREDGCLSYPRYERYLRKMNKRYLGVIPGFGVPNFQLAAGDEPVFSPLPDRSAGQMVFKLR